MSMPNASPTGVNTTPNPLLPLDQAIASLLEAALPITAPEAVLLDAADGRVLAQDLYSQLDVPAFDNAAMDGYAVRAADAQKPNTVLPVALRVAAGDSPGALPPTSAARIFTGAPIPQGANAVVMQEHCEPLAATDAATAHVRFKAVVQAGQHVRQRGSDIALGSVALARGHRLDPAALGLAASLGLDCLSVAAKPRVCLFSTGNELHMPGSIAPTALPAGAIFNSNRFFLQAGLQRLGCRVTDGGNLPDDLSATQSALSAAAKTHDVLLCSGGVSVGEADYVRAAVQSLGQVKLWRLAIKPGKPFAYGCIDNAQKGSQAVSHFIGLPGNPVSSYVTFLLLVRPFLLRLQGLQDVAPHTQTATASFVLKADTRRNFVRVRCDAQRQLHLYPDQSSGVLTSVVWGDGLADIPIGQAVQPGDSLHFLPFATFF